MEGLSEERKGGKEEGRRVGGRREWGKEGEKKREGGLRVLYVD